MAQMDSSIVSFEVYCKYFVIHLVTITCTCVFVDRWVCEFLREIKRKRNKAGMCVSPYTCVGVFGVDFEALSSLFNSLQ